MEEGVEWVHTASEGLVCNIYAGPGPWSPSRSEVVRGVSRLSRGVPCLAICVLLRAPDLAGYNCTYDK